MTIEKRIELAARLLGDIVWRVKDQPEEYRRVWAGYALDWADSLIDVAEDRYND